MIKRIAKFIFLLLAPVLLALLWIAFVLSDLTCGRKRRSSRPAEAADPSSRSGASLGFSPPRNASIVIPNWNGRDLLEKYLPAVVAACGPSDEIIVVDNASSDGSAEWLRHCFPQVRVLEMERNLGFGGGCNAGVRAACHSVVVLLNNDMRVAPDFLPPLLEGFTDPDVFAVSAQIFFSDPSRRREETGLTAGWFSKGFLRVRHDADPSITRPFPTFYAGGGSTAYDRAKFLELGGFDSLFEPFYLEDTDLSYGAWRRSWKVLFQPASRLFHEHRGTIGKHYTAEAIRAYLHKNYVLMVWKNIHQKRWLLKHFVCLYGHMALNSLGWRTETRTTIGSFAMALRQFPQALRSRRRALLRATVSDAELFQRVRPSVFRETLLREQPEFLAHPEASPDRERDVAGPAPLSQSDRRLNILFVSPYSVYPPLHGGAVFMLQAIQELAKRHNIYLLTFVDRAEEAESNRSLEGKVRKVEVLVRRHRRNLPFHLASNAERTFYDPDFAALLDKMVLLHEIDLIQFEYTQLAQYRLPLRLVPQCLFEHDLYFRSVQRQLWTGTGSLLVKARELLEWLRAIRYEVAAASRFDAVFTCNDREQQLLESLLKTHGVPAVRSGLRTAVDAASYRYPGGPRQPDSLLFVGNFQHRPNTEGLQVFCETILPLIRARRPQATLQIAGANAPPEWEHRFAGDGIRLLGQVPDIREPLSACFVFVCPIWMGAGVRVKILEAFASGIPVVSTSFGAEGLAATAGVDLLLADSPRAFADACLTLMEQPRLAERMAASARRLVETRYDWPVVAAHLEEVYHALVSSRRKAPVPLAASPVEVASRAGVIAR